jgi:cytochrome c-type biogenesis protein CcmH
VTVFIVLAALLAALAVVLVVWPLFRPRQDEEGKPVIASPGAAVAIAVVLPALAFVLYFSLSDWPWDPQAQAQAQAKADGEAAPLAQMASQLAERLSREKGDAEGWKMLGRTYVVMNDFPKALNAYEQAYTLTSGADVDALLGYAEAKVLVNEAEFEGEAGRLFVQAVSAAPTNPKALWYAGLTEFRRQDLAAARAHWQALRNMGGPQEIMQIVEARLAEIDAAIGPSTDSAAVVAAPPAVPAGASAEVKTTAGPTAEGIDLRIEVAPGLAGQVPSGMTLFILARSGNGGPPLAAIRRSSDELPLDITLTDANAMIPGTSLKQVESLDLVARVSLTGRPMASPGDLYGEVRYDPASSGRVRLTIDRVVK